MLPQELWKSLSTQRLEPTVLPTTPPACAKFDVGSLPNGNEGEGLRLNIDNNTLRPNDNEEVKRNNTPAVYGHADVLAAIGSIDFHYQRPPVSPNFPDFHKNEDRRGQGGFDPRMSF